MTTDASSVDDPDAFYLLSVFIDDEPPAIGQCVVSGLHDEQRMRRALCYFDNALFACNDNNARHKQDLLAKSSYEGRTTGAMFTDFVKAYSFFVEASSPGVNMFVSHVERTSRPLLTRPSLVACRGRPQPHAFEGLICCLVCFRVEERGAGAITCERCSGL